MRSGTIAFLLGILCIQGITELPDALYVQFLPVVLMIAVLSRRARIASCFLCGLLWCLLRVHTAMLDGLPAQWNGVDLVAEGTIVGVPESRGTRTRFLFQLDAARPLDRINDGSATATTRFGGRVRLNWYDAPPVRSGERWRLAVRLRPPRGTVNPGVIDYERWLFINRIRASGYVRNVLPASRIDAGDHWNIDRARQRIAAHIADLLPGHAAAGIVSALAVGLRQNISDDQWSILRNTGTAHLMAISGLHVALVAGFAFLIVRALWSRWTMACLRLPAPKAGAIAALAAGTAYAAMAGFSLPTQRALILLAVLMWCRIAGRSHSFSAALCLALWVVLVVDPFSVLGPSLWLSFGAVAVLGIGMMPRIHAERPPAFSRIWCAWGKPQLVVVIGLAPVLFLNFGQQPLSAPIANAVAIPWMGFLVVPAAVGGALLSGVWPGAGDLLLRGAATGITLVWPFLEGIDRLVPALRAGGEVSLGWTLLAIAGALLLLMPREVPARWLGGVLMLPPLIFRPAAPAADSLRYTLLDVGHGLSVVVQTHRHSLVFDAGPGYPGGFDAGRRIVAPYLHSRGLHRVDSVIISHSDADHAGGIAGLLAEIPATRILGRRGSPCLAGQAWRWDGYLFSVIHPKVDDDFESNNRSCVLRVRGPGGSLLITGDIESAAERALIRRYGDELRSDVLIVPHHGSITSSTPAFIATVRPAIALISNTRIGRYRLPHPEVVRRYAKAGAVLMETANSGAISGELNGLRPPTLPRAEREIRRRYWRQRERL